MLNLRKRSLGLHKIAGHNIHGIRSTPACSMQKISQVGRQAAYGGIMRADSQETRALAALWNGSNIYAGHPACNVLLFHLQQLPCLGELKVDDFSAGQGQDDLHLDIVLDGA